MLAASTAFADAAWLVPETLPLCVPFGPLPVNDPSSPVNDPPPLNDPLGGQMARGGGVI